MSWHATAWVKRITKHADGKPITAREKLVLFVLADYHHSKKNVAWAGLTAIAKDALSSRRHLLRILATLEAHGTLKIQHRDKETNLYFFPTLPPEDPSDTTSLPRDIPTPPRDTRCHQGRDIAMSPELALNPQLETQKKGASAKDRKVSWPKGFALTEGMRQDALRLGVPNPASEFEAWRDYCKGHGSVYIDWEAAWRTRCRNYLRFNGRVKADTQVEANFGEGIRDLGELMRKERAEEKEWKSPKNSPAN